MGLCLCLLTFFACVLDVISRYFHDGVKQSSVSLVYTFRNYAHVVLFCPAY